MKSNVTIFDTTLRDGEQAPGASMRVDEKIDIARQLARLGVDVLEAGFPISSPQQEETVARIAEAIDGPVVCALARALEKDVRAAGRALADARRRRIHTFIATSDIHIEAKFDDDRFGKTLPEKREAVVRMAQRAVTVARAYTDDVEFSAEDAGRTDPAYLCDVIAAAVEAGASTINIPDTTGYCTPVEYAALFERAAECIPDGHDVVLSAHCHDDLGLAVANSIAAVNAGARQVECTINGIGERAGNASLEEIVMALRVRHDHFGLTTNVDPRELAKSSRMVSVATGFAVPPNKSIVGRNAFSHEAGIHQHGVLKRRETYEIMRAEDVGQSPEQIRLGRHSGRHGFFQRLEQLDVEIAPSQRNSLYERFTELADQKKEVHERDLLYLVESVKRSGFKPHYRLDSFNVTVDSQTRPRASVRIIDTQENNHLEYESTGDGPVDALLRAADHAIGSPHDLIDYHLESVTEGADALGEVTVKVREDGKTFEGTARHTDILRASIEAYLQALNRLEATRAQKANSRFVGNGIMQSFTGSTF